MDSALVSIWACTRESVEHKQLLHSPAHLSSREFSSSSYEAGAYIMTRLCGVRAGLILFRGALDALLRSPVSFYDTSKRFSHPNHGHNC